MASADRLIEVFTEAKGLPAGAEREGFLAEACRDEPALQTQVLGLLQAHEGAGDFLRQTHQISPASLLTEKPGDRIGRYKLLQQIGEGGCGVVYMAEQEEPVRRRVALKVIKLGMDTKSVIARFEAERQALALMDHPNIAKVLDAGATDMGRPYFVMELVRGIKITDCCDENKLSTPERLKLFTQVCHAIQHAHQKGIIHRDIKPSNILVTINEPGALGCPKVIDFGIAKAATGQRLTDKTVFTAFEQFIGTPAYMSPEQAMMTSLDIDTRTDIYSLGVLLYELLTGQTPFDAKELLAAGLDEMRRTIREKEPPRPSTRLSAMTAEALTTTAKNCHTDAPKLMHAVRGDLDWIVMKCLEKDRARRYETASGLAMDIQRHLNCEPVVARPRSRLYEFQKTVRRHKFGFVAAAALITVLAIGVLVSTSEAIRATREQRIAKRERDRALRAENDAQRQKANAQTEARNAAAQLAESLINQGDALTTAAEFPAAYARYAEAAGQLEKLGHPLARLDLSLVRLYRASPPPLWRTNLGEFINGMATLPSRKEIIAASSGKLYALDQLTGAVLRSFGDAAAARSLASAASPDGPVLLMAGGNFVRLLDPTNGTVLRQVRDDRAAKFCVVSPDGSLAASANDEGTLMLWEIATFKPVGLGKPGGKVQHAAFSQDGATLVTAGDSVALWDVKTGQQLRRLSLPASSCVVFGADDHALLLGEASGFVTVASLDGKALARWPVSRSYFGIRSMVAAPQGNRLITASYDGEVRVFDNSFDGGWTPTLTMATDQGNMLVTAYVAETGPKACAAASGLSAADEGVVIACTRFGQVFAWPLRAPDRFRDRVEGAISISPDGLLYAGQVPGRIEVRDVATDRTLRRLPQSANCRATAFSHDSRLLYIGDDRGVLRAFDLLRCEYIWAMHAHDDWIQSIDLAPDGILVASSAQDGTTRAWDARTGALVGSLHHQGGYGTAAVFVPGADSSQHRMAASVGRSQNQRIIIGGGDGGVLYDWNIFSEAKPRQASGPGPIRSLTLSPDHKLLAVGSTAHGAALLNAATLERVGSLGPIPSGVYQVCFIDPGTGAGTWALACGASELRAFDLSSSRESFAFGRTFRGQVGTETETGMFSPHTLAASADGQTAVARATGRISFTLPRRRRELLRTPSPARQAEAYAEWGVWAWARELLERERIAGRECPVPLSARAHWMCGDYASAREAFDLAVQRHQLPPWYAELCRSVADSPPSIPPLAAVARPLDPGEQAPAEEPLPEGVLAAGEVPALNSQIGQEVVVEGVVANSEWSRSGKVMNISFASVEKGKRGLLGSIFLKNRAAFDGAFGGDAANAFSGARLRLRGTPQRYGGFVEVLKGLPEMILKDPKQVTIVQQAPAHGELPVPFSAAGKSR